MKGSRINTGELFGSLCLLHHADIG